MTPKEKAEELIRKYDCGGLTTFLGHDVKIISKQCALIAVDEAEKSEYNVLAKFGFVSHKYTSAYWKEVKQEIEKI